MMGSQSKRIFSEFFKYVGPSRVQYKSVADQGDEAIFLKAIDPAAQGKLAPRLRLKLGSWVAGWNNLCFRSSLSLSQLVQMRAPLRVCAVVLLERCQAF
jgi:hypothetical protein